MYSWENASQSLPHVFAWCFKLSVALYIMDFIFKFAFWSNSSNLNNSGFAVRRKEGGVLSSETFLAPNAGALRILDAAICSIVKGFWVLSLPGNVRFLDFLFGDRSSPVSLRHLFIPLPGQRSKRKAMTQWCFWEPGLSRHQRLSGLCCTNLIIQVVSEVRNHTVCDLIFTV